MGFSLLDNQRAAFEQLKPNPVFPIHNGPIMRAIEDLDHTTFEDCYVPHPRHEDVGLRSALYGSKIFDDPMFGHHESCILNYALNDMKETLVFIGSVGSGKSTVLKNVKRLIEKYNDVAGKLIPVRIDLNAKKSDMETVHADKGQGALEAFVDATVRGKIIGALEFHVRSRSEMNEHMWKTEHDLSTARITSSAFDDLKDAEYAMEHRAKALAVFYDSPNFVHALARLIVAQTGKRVLLMIDNIDPCNHAVQEKLLWIAHKYQADPNVGILVSVRESTYNLLKPGISALSPPELRLPLPDIRQILKRRSTFLETLLERARTSEAYNEILASEGLLGVDTGALVLAMLNAVLSDDVVEEIEWLSDFNARLALKFLPMYLSSPYVHSGPFVSQVSHERQDELAESDIPGHVLVQSIITNNRKTYNGRSTYPTVMNIWCDASAEYPWSHFSQMIVLRIIASGSVSVNALDQKLDDLFLRCNVALEYFESNIRRITLRLLNHWLLRTPTFLTEHRHASLDVDAHGVGPNQRGVRRQRPLEGEELLEISYAGRYYIYGSDNRQLPLAYRLEYFSYIKDHILFDRRIRAVSCITKPRLSDRLVNSVVAASEILAKEDMMYEFVSSDTETWERYKDAVLVGDGQEPSLLSSPFRKSFATVLESIERNAPEHAVRNARQQFEQYLDELTKVEQRWLGS